MIKKSDINQYGGLLLTQETNNDIDDKAECFIKEHPEMNKDLYKILYIIENIPIIRSLPLKPVATKVANVLSKLDDDDRNIIENEIVKLYKKNIDEIKKSISNKNIKFDYDELILKIESKDKCPIILNTEITISFLYKKDNFCYYAFEIDDFVLEKDGEKFYYEKFDIIKALSKEEMDMINELHPPDIEDYKKEYLKNHLLKYIRKDDKDEEPDISDDFILINIEKESGTEHFIYVYYPKVDGYVVNLDNGNLIYTPMQVIPSISDDDYEEIRTLNPPYIDGYIRTFGPDFKLTYEKIEKDVEKPSLPDFELIKEEINSSGNEIYTYVPIINGYLYDQSQGIYKIDDTKIDILSLSGSKDKIYKKLRPPEIPRYVKKYNSNYLLTYSGPKADINKQNEIIATLKKAGYDCIEFESKDNKDTYKFVPIEYGYVFKEINSDGKLEYVKMEEIPSIDKVSNNKLKKLYGIYKLGFHKYYRNNHILVYTQSSKNNEYPGVISGFELVMFDNPIISTVKKGGGYSVSNSNKYNIANNKYNYSNKLSSSYDDLLSTEKSVIKGGTVDEYQKIAEELKKNYSKGNYLSIFNLNILNETNDKKKQELIANFNNITKDSINVLTTSLKNILSNADLISKFLSEYRKLSTSFIYIPLVDGYTFDKIDNSKIVYKKMIYISVLEPLDQDKLMKLHPPYLDGYNKKYETNYLLKYTRFDNKDIPTEEIPGFLFGGKNQKLDHWTYYYYPKIIDYTFNNIDFDTDAITYKGDKELKLEKDKDVLVDLEAIPERTFSDTLSNEDKKKLATKIKQINDSIKMKMHALIRIQRLMKRRLDKIRSGIKGGGGELVIPQFDENTYIWTLDKKDKRCILNPQIDENNSYHLTFIGEQDEKCQYGLDIDGYVLTKEGSDYKYKKMTTDEKYHKYHPEDIEGFEKTYTPDQVLTYTSLSKEKPTTIPNIPNFVMQGKTPTQNSIGNWVYTFTAEEPKKSEEPKVDKPKSDWEEPKPTTTPTKTVPTTEKKPDEKNIKYPKILQNPLLSPDEKNNLMEDLTRVLITEGNKPFSSSKEGIKIAFTKFIKKEFIFVVDKRGDKCFNNKGQMINSMDKDGKETDYKFIFIGEYPDINGKLKCVYALNIDDYEIKREDNKYFYVKIQSEAKPAVGEATPAVGEAKPAAGEATPAVGEATPAVGEATPAVGEATPAVGEATPAVGEATPAVGEAKSEAKSEVKLPCPSEGKEPVPCENEETSYKKQVLTFDPDKNSGCSKDATTKFKKLFKLCITNTFSQLEETDEKIVKQILQDVLINKGIRPYINESITESSFIIDIDNGYIAYILPYDIGKPSSYYYPVGSMNKDGEKNNTYTFSYSFEIIPRRIIIDGKIIDNEILHIYNLDIDGYTTVKYVGYFPLYIKMEDIIGIPDGLNANLNKLRPKELKPLPPNIIGLIYKQEFKDVWVGGKYYESYTGESYLRNGLGVYDKNPVYFIKEYMPNHMLIYLSTEKNDNSLWNIENVEGFRFLDIKELKTDEERVSILIRYVPDIPGYRFVRINDNNRLVYDIESPISTTLSETYPELKYVSEEAGRQILEHANKLNSTPKFQEYNINGNKPPNKFGFKNTHWYQILGKREDNNAFSPSLEITDLEIKKDQIVNGIRIEIENGKEKKIFRRNLLTYFISRWYLKDDKYSLILMNFATRGQQVIPLRDYIWCYIERVKQKNLLIPSFEPIKVSSSSAPVPSAPVPSAPAAPAASPASAAPVPAPVPAAPAAIPSSAPAATAAIPSPAPVPSAPAVPAAIPSPAPVPSAPAVPAASPVPPAPVPVPAPVPAPVPVPAIPPVASPVISSPAIPSPAVVPVPEVKIEYDYFMLIKTLREKNEEIKKENSVLEMLLNSYLENPNIERKKSKLKKIKEKTDSIKFLIKKIDELSLGLSRLRLSEETDLSDDQLGGVKEKKIRTHKSEIYKSVTFEEKKIINEARRMIVIAREVSASVDLELAQITAELEEKPKEEAAEAAVSVSTTTEPPAEPPVPAAQTRAAAREAEQAAEAMLEGVPLSMDDQLILLEESEKKVKRIQKEQLDRMMSLEIKRAKPEEKNKVNDKIETIVNLRKEIEITEQLIKETEKILLNTKSALQEYNENNSVENKNILEKLLIQLKKQTRQINKKSNLITDLDLTLSVSLLKIGGVKGQQMPEYIQTPENIISATELSISKAKKQITISKKTLEKYVKQEIEELKKSEESRSKKAYKIKKNKEITSSVESESLTGGASDNPFMKFIMNRAKDVLDSKRNALESERNMLESELSTFSKSKKYSIKNKN
jgi:hypothetical protein